MTLERGYLLNKRYRIVEILGQGGMAAVYRAVDENLGVEVALKENLFTTDEYARQFRREAVILANLRHPNLPRVTDHFVIEQQGQYLVMDYIEGEDMRQRMDRIGALPEQEVVIVGAAICDALTYLHTRKPMVLHRDLKPGNVKITPQGHIFLVDFGLAKVMQGRQATTTGARAMTPGYSPPEQYGTARTDHRSDIYSLGATLYSGLTDAIPEDGLARAMEQAGLTPLVKRNPKINRKLANSIEKALEVRPDDRYQSAEDFKADLLNTRSTTRRKLPLELTVDPPPMFTEEAVSIPDIPDRNPQAGEPEGKPAETDKMSFPISTPLVDIPAPTPVRRRRKFNWNWLWLIPLLLLICGAVAMSINPNIPNQAMAWLQPNHTPTPTTVPDTPVSPVPPPATATATERILPSLTPTPLPTASPTLTPSPTVTPSPQPTQTPTLAPSPTPVGGGTGQLAFVSDRSGIPEIYLMDLSGKILSQVTNISAGACQPAWHPDGERLLFTSPCPRNKDLYPGSSLFLINADGTGLMPFLPSVPGGDFSPAWSPDGKSVAFVSMRNSDIPQIYVLNTATNTLTLLGEDPPRPNYNPSWSPDGKQIVFASSNNQIMVMNSDGSNRFLLARNTSTFINGNPTWSQQGLAVIFSEWSPDRITAWLMAVPYSSEGALPVRINGTDYGFEPEFSPDGFWIVYTGFPSGNRDIYIITPSGVGGVQLTSDPANDFDPAWRPIPNLP